jgi:hypothetical protein
MDCTSRAKERDAMRMKTMEDDCGCDVDNLCFGVKRRMGMGG